MIEKIATDKSPSAIGPYSQGMVFDKFVFTSGQIPLDAKTGEVCGSDITVQTECALKNVQAVLEAGGSCLENVLKTTCFLSDMANFAPFNSVYETFFTGKPARSCFAVKELPKGVLVEVEAIAVKKD